MAKRVPMLSELDLKYGVKKEIMKFYLIGRLGYHGILTPDTRNRRNILCVRTDNDFLTIRSQALHFWDV
jgi:hypothetical protein